MKFRPAILLVSLLLLVGPTSAMGAELFQRLEGREFQGRSIVGAHGTHPVRHPDDLQLFFGTAELSGYGDATPTLYWKSRCNGHDYILTFVHQRLHTSAQISTKKRCTGQSDREERWLEDFFAADLTWSLRHGRLTLTSGQRQIVLAGKWLLGQPAMEGLAPKALTTAAIGVAGTEAVVRGVIDARDQPTRFKFEYGPTRSYGMTTEASEEVVTGHVNNTVAEALAGLSPRTTYHYRIVAFNRSGSVRGNDRTFTTTRRR